MALELECLDLVPEQPGPARAARHLAGACIALRDVTRANGYDRLGIRRLDFPGPVVGADDGRCRYVRRVARRRSSFGPRRASGGGAAGDRRGPARPRTDLRVPLTRAESRLDEDRSRARLVAVPRSLRAAPRVDAELPRPVDSPGRDPRPLCRGGRGPLLVRTRLNAGVSRDPDAGYPRGRLARHAPRWMSVAAARQRIPKARSPGDGRGGWGIGCGDRPRRCRGRGVAPRPTVRRTGRRGSSPAAGCWRWWRSGQ